MCLKGWALEAVSNTKLCPPKITTFSLHITEIKSLIMGKLSGFFLLFVKIV